MKKIVLVVMLLLLIGCQAEEVMKEPMTIVSEMNQAIKDFDYSELLMYDFDESIKDVMTEDTLKQAFDGLGAVVEQQMVVPFEKEGFKMFKTPTVFENGAFDIVIGFNENIEIVSFYIDVFTGEQEMSTDIEVLAKEYLMLFVEQEFEALVDLNYTSDMKAVSTKVFYEDLYNNSRWGDFIKSHEVIRYEMSGYEVVSIPCEFENGSINYTVLFDASDKIAGLRFDEFQLKEAESVEEGFVEEIVIADVNGMTLDGILTKPEGDDKWPCIILVHGSGASDKDETIFQNKPFRDIAHGLAQLGIASYRYDKGSYAHPEKFVNQLDFTLENETVNDAVAIYEMIDNRDDIDDVYILGHSLGGYAIPLMASQTKAAGYVIMAGSVDSIHELIPQQYSYLFNQDGQITEQEQEQLDAVVEEMAKVNNLDAYPEDEVIFGAYKAYWAYMLTYDPLELAKAIEEPVLVLQGKRDYQVTMTQYEKWQSVGDENWTFKTYDDLNHLMMPGEGPANNAEYTTLNHVSEILIKDIANWVKSDE